MLSRKETTALHKLIMCNNPELFDKSIKEIAKIKCTIDVSKVSQIKAAFDLCNISDKRIFIAIVFKKFHPAMYNEDNRSLTIKQGLCKAVADVLNMKESNCSNLFKEVRTWLKYNIEDLRTKTEEVFDLIETKLLTVKAEKCQPSLFE